jgi:putative OPT family oligopeptide transporter
VAIGYIVGLQIAVLVFAGGALGWLVALPILGGAAPDVAPLDTAWDVWSDQIRFLGVGAMVVGGLSSFWQVRRGIVSGLTSLGRIGGTADQGRASVLRTERNMALGWLLVILLATTIGTAMFYETLTGSATIAAVATVIMVVTSFLLVAVATYIAGLVGSSNSPVSGMTIVALMVAAGVMLGLGIAGDSAILATLGIAGVVCCATCTSGDVAQDLKTGLLVGATPARQQMASLAAAIVPAFFFAPILTLLHHAYGIGTGEPGSLRAPQAALFASLTSGFFGEGELPWTMIWIGAGFGFVLIAINGMLARADVPFRAHVMPVAVGLYLPFSLAVPILLGGLLHHTVGRRGDESRDHGVLFGSGLIAGEALVGILLAGVIVAGVGLPVTLVDHWVPSLAVFAAVVWWLSRAARESPG